MSFSSSSLKRYISLERLIEQNKDRYYETLEQSSQGWHEGKHDPWPYINYLLFIFKTAYREFESRLAAEKSPRGAKTGLIETAIQSFPGEFTLADLEWACPGVSHDMIRKVLRNLQRSGTVECLGRGPGAAWKKGKTSRQAKDANDPETFLALIEKTGMKIETIDTALWDEETLANLNEAVTTLRQRLDVRFPGEDSGPSTELA